MLTAIFLIITIGSLGVVLFVVIHKFPQLANLDIKNLQEEKIFQKKKEIINKRIEENSNLLKKRIVGALTPLRKIWGKLQLQFKDARRFNALVNDAGIAAALRTAAAKFYEGEQRLVNVRFTGPASFMVADLQKNADGSGYDAGQFAPKVYLLGGGRAKLVLTYFRMNNSHSYDYNEVASFEFDNCVK